MIQCAGSRDRRRLRYCFPVCCCMIALKHAIRLRTLFPQLKVTILYLEIEDRRRGLTRTGFWPRGRAGVEFLRGNPPEVQFDGQGRPVIEVEDMTGARKRLLRPDLVVLSSGMVPASDTARIAEALSVDLDGRTALSRSWTARTAPTDEPRGRLCLRLRGGAEGAGGVQHRSLGGGREIHTSSVPPARRGAAASTVDAAACVGCDVCFSLCPFHPITLAERPADAPRPAEVKDEGKLAVIDAGLCPRLRHLRRNCTEMRSRTTSATRIFAAACSS